jgi:UDP-2,3-diacylglucosamine pyrophosphatase LpxH
VHATLSKYGYVVDEVSDAFGKRGRQIIKELSSKLPPDTKQALDHVFDQLDEVMENLKAIEAAMINVFAPCPQTTWLESLPGVGKILAVVIWTEIFDHLNLEFEVKTRHLKDGQRPRVKKHRLKKSHLKALTFISGLSKPENGCEVVWIEGNHDEGISYIFSSLIGATVYNEYMWEFAGKKCLAVHGDQFDQFYRNHLNLVEWGTWAYQALQSFGPKAYPLCLYLKNNSKHYARAINIVAENAARYANKKGANVIFCGHTHHAEHKRIGGIDYYNSGTMQSNITSVPVSRWANRVSGFTFLRKITAPRN